VCVTFLYHRAAAAVSSSAGSAAVSMIHSLPGHAAVRCISVLQNAVICACNDGQVYRIPLSVITVVSTFSLELVALGT